MRKTGPTNPVLRAEIRELRKQKAKIWKRIAKDLQKSTRNRRAVNLSRVNRHAKAGETIVVPGKVLSAGTLDKKITIAAWQFSKAAEEKIKAAGGKAITLKQLLEKNPKGTKVRLIG
ncbi:50S ribosomal protein L18e [Candidatus Woesearchaeota archaeon]|nr:50S ribosomal protein L18e [Candidatus Woesearchaeota archaeon]